MALASCQILLSRLRGLADRQTDSPADADLLARFVNSRDEAAFELLVWRHGGMVHRVCQSLLRHEADADDAFQATFLALARDAASITQGQSCAGWLYRVAFRMANKIRLKQHVVEVLPSDVTAVDGDPAHLASNRELLALLFAEIQRLPRRYREPVVLCLLEGKTRSEAARQLQCPGGTIDSRLAYARKRLRDRLLRAGVAPAIATAGALGFAGDSLAVSAKLASQVVRASLLFLGGGRPALVGEVSTQTLKLLQGATMFSTKVKLFLAAAVVLGAIGLATNGRYDHPAAAEDPPVPARNAPADLEWRLMAATQVGQAPVTSLMFAPGGKLLVANGGKLDSPELLFLDVPSGKIAAGWQVNLAVRHVAFSPDGKRLASVEGIPGVAVVRSADTGKQVRLWATQGVRVHSLAFAPDGKVLALGTQDGSVLLWPSDQAVDAKEKQLSVEKAAVDAVAFTPDGKRLVTAGDGNVRIWDVASGKQVTESVDWSRGKRDIAVSPDGKIVAIARANSVQLFEIANATPGFAIDLEALKGGEGTHDVASVAFSPNGKELAFASNQLLSDNPNGTGEVHIYDLATRKQTSHMKLPKGFIVKLAWSPDGKYLAAGSQDGTVYLWGRLVVQSSATVEIQKTVGFDRLIEELAKSQRSPEACTEALFLAALGRFPTETERSFSSAHITKSADRRESLRDVLFQLTNTREFQEHAAALQSQLPKLPGR
jgi:RNA polymerase sigma factor (sigma-70 family)